MTNFSHKPNQSFILHHDNGAEISMLVRKFLGKNKTIIMPQTPYSPDLVPAAFFLSPKTEDTDERKVFC